MEPPKAKCDGCGYEKDMVQRWGEGGIWRIPEFWWVRPIGAQHELVACSIDCLTNVKTRIMQPELESREHP